MSSHTLRRLQIALFVIGLAISAAMVARSQVAGDQLSFLGRGWLLAFEGELVPYGMLTSSGGNNPGAVTSLLSGLPLMVWEDHRAPSWGVWLIHLGAFALLFRLFRRVLGRGEMFLFVLLFWFSPWRLYYSSFSWPPNYMVAIGALYTATLFALRREKRLGWSLLHVAIVGLAFQIHASFFLLVVASALLLWRRYFRLHLAGAVLGALAVVASLVPWLLAVSEDSSLLPTGGGMPGRGLLLVFPVVRGFLYWIRYSSLAVSESFFALEGVAETAVPVLVYLTAIPALWANYRLWRGRSRTWWQEVAADADDREWLEGLVRWILLATLCTVALSPTTVMSWQLLPFFHFATLPLVLAGGDLLRAGRSLWVRAGAPAYAALSLAAAILVLVASPMHRCGGLENGALHTLMPALRADHPIFDDLGIRRTCPVVVDDPAGWWTDVLPEAVPAQPHAGGGPG